MSNSTILPNKERISRLFLTAISLAGGWIFVQFGLLNLNRLNQPYIFGLMVLFLFIVQLYPLPIWRGSTTISFPLVYAIYVVEGLSNTLVTYALVVLIINLFYRRPLRIILFNPSLLLVSLYIAYQVDVMLPFTDGSAVFNKIYHFTVMMLLFYVINNLIVDFIFIMRPQVYRFQDWSQKTILEANGFLISFVYLLLFFVLGSQSRGESDVFSFFFFFSPLVCFALLGSRIANLKKERSKFKALVGISSELNKRIAAANWLSFLADHLEDFIDVDAWILWKREKEGWNLRFTSGLVNERIELTDEAASALDKLKHLVVYHETAKGGGPVLNLFCSGVKSLLYAPLILDKELVGMFVFGRSRPKSFTEEDLQSAATIASQLAVLIKTKWLITEQEKRIILEERNRIARDIHDGVAQSLAGVILKLETANRKFPKTPEDSWHLVVESTEKLRMSLKEVRESIYALRPYPTERVGLLPAVASKVKVLQKETNISIEMETRGRQFQISPMAEKVIFDIFQESIQNAIKHAEASKIEILLSYQKEHVLLKVKDDGKGFSLFQAMIKAQNHPHFGILHMNEAAEKIQATLQVDSKEGAGAEISLIVPRMGIEGGVFNDQAYASR